MIPVQIVRKIDKDLGVDPNHDILAEDHLFKSFRNELLDITSVHSFPLISDTKNNQKTSDYSSYIGSYDHKYRIKACTCCGDERKIAVACGRRLCFTCAKVYLEQRRSYLCDKFSQILLANDIKNHGLRFLTLTFKNVPHLEGWVDKLQLWVKSFRRSFKVNLKLSAYSILGGSGNVEVTYNSIKDNWHIHVHMTIEGNFIPHEILKSQWIKTTGNMGEIVDIRLIKNDTDSIVNTAFEVAKYNAKPNNINDWPMRRIKEFERSVHGKRLFFTFGDWYNDRVYPHNNECSHCGALDSMIILDFIIPDLIRERNEHLEWQINNPSIEGFG